MCRVSVIFPEWFDNRCFHFETQRRSVCSLFYSCVCCEGMCFLSIQYTTECLRWKNVLSWEQMHISFGLKKMFCSWLFSLKMGEKIKNQFDLHIPMMIFRESIDWFFFFGIKCNTKKYAHACKCIDILGRKMRVNNARLSFGEIWVGREMTVAYLVFFYVSYFSILLWVFFLLSVALCVAFRFLKMKQQS